MHSNSPLVDHGAVWQKRKRSRAESSPFSDFHDLAIREIDARLNDIQCVPKRVAVVTGFPNIWKHAFPQATIVRDDNVLSFPRNPFDLIIHGLCLHWANDPLGQIIQCREACSPGGMFIAVLFGAQTLQELRTALIHAESQIAGGSSPRVVPMGDLLDLGNLVVRANLTDPVSDRLEIRRTYASMFELMSHLRAMGETNSLAARSKHFTRRGIFTAANQIYRDQFAHADGRVYATFELVFLTGWAPNTVRNALNEHI